VKNQYLIPYGQNRNQTYSQKRNQNHSSEYSAEYAGFHLVLPNFTFL